MVEEFDARSVLDIGCGTGTFACLLAAGGVSVTAVDPNEWSLAIARAKPGADQIRWVHGYAPDALPLSVELATMTANVAQEIVTDEDWGTTLRAAWAALRPGGRLIFETRDPARKAWLSWDRDHTYQNAVVPGLGAVECWLEVVDVSDDLVTFGGSYFFEDGLRLHPVSRLRFRAKDEVAASLAQVGFEVTEIRDAPDRPGREFVFIASRPGS